MMPIRPEKVAMSIKRTVAQIIHGELNDPRIGFATVTNVEVTNDLKFCKIFISIMGNEKVKKGTMIALDRARGFIRKLVGDRLKLRYTPDIVFRLDETALYREHIDELFKKLDLEKKTDGDE